MKAQDQNPILFYHHGISVKNFDRPKMVIGYFILKAGDVDHMEITKWCKLEFTFQLHGDYGICESTWNHYELTLASYIIPLVHVFY